MTDRDAILRSETFKNSGMDIQRRVFYTLTADPDFQAHRAAKAMGVLLQHLNSKGILSENVLDDLLLEAVS